MSKYIFSLHNYHAVGSADIRLDGITVIAGQNGCGKSTIARWLYAFVKYSNEFEDIIDRTLLKNINRILRRMNRVARSLDSEMQPVARQLRDIPLSILSDTEISLFDETSDAYARLAEIFNAKLDAFTTALNRDLKLNDSPETRMYLARTLNFRAKAYNDFANEFYDFMLEKVHNDISLADDIKNSHQLADLFKIIGEELDCGTDFPRGMNFSEGEEELISPYGKFFAPIGIDRAIYVDTPMALSNFETVEAAVWKSLRDSITKPAGEMPLSARKTIQRLRRVMGGNVALREDEFGISSELRYVRREDGLDIPINEAATGVKTFAYMLRLVENGWLTDSSILLIDEPEAHLHPQWIVEFARILVMLNKEVGTRIVLASHDPDMIAAIQSISEAQGTGETTRFYQAQPEPGTLRYRFEDLGNSVEEIFRSFNIALERISAYGIR